MTDDGRVVSASAGRSTRRYRKLRSLFRTLCLEQARPCWLCWQPIDYELGAEDEQSFSLDHRFPLSTHPHLAEDPGNFEAAHLECNKRRGNRDAPLTLGMTSRPW